MPGVSGTRSTPSVGGTPAAPATPATPVTLPPDTTRRTERRPDPAKEKDNPPRNAWGR